jgi:tetratricopeptide (TPR) repeat protein
VTPAQRSKAGYAAAYTIVAFIGLFFLDRALANLERTELQSEAARGYREGMELLRSNQPARAAERLQRAYSLQRGNRDYALGYAEALSQGDRREDSAALVRQMLARSSNDGEANLLMARLSAADGKAAEADAFYHRAVYGTWTGNSEARILQTRLELAGYLAAHGTSRGLLAELLILQDQASNDPALARRVAELLLESGSPARSAALYRELLNKEPRAPDLFQGLGRAELAAGDYRQATAAFMDQLRVNPGNADATHWLRLSSQLSRLDPTPRNLSSAEKHRRSVELLSGALAQLEQCAPGAGALTEARALESAAKTKRTPANEESEAALETAVRVWHERLRLCASAPLSDDPIPILMKKIPTSP